MHYFCWITIILLLQFPNHMLARVLMNLEGNWAVLWVIFEEKKLCIKSEYILFALQICQFYSFRWQTPTPKQWAGCSVCENFQGELFSQIWIQNQILSTACQRDNNSIVSIHFLQQLNTLWIYDIVSDITHKISSINSVQSSRYFKQLWSESLRTSERGFRVERSLL